jgi:hypothetical protein
MGVFNILIYSLAPVVIGGTQYETYSSYGFSFEYPRGAPVSEQGSLSAAPDRTSGIVGIVTMIPSVENPYFENAIFKWDYVEEAPDLAATFEAEFEELAAAVGTNGQLERLLVLGDASAAGYPAKAQVYTVQGGGLPRSAVMGVWYCDRNKTLYKFELQRLGIDTLGWVLSQGLEGYERYLSSFTGAPGLVDTTPSTATNPLSRSGSVPTIASPSQITQSLPEPKNASDLPLGPSSCPVLEKTSFDQAMFRGNPRHTGAYEGAKVSQLHAQKWAFRTPRLVFTPVIADGVGYFSDLGGNVYAVDIETGKERWRFRADNQVSASVALGAA